MVFEFYELKYLEKVYLKLNLVQFTKQERSQIDSHYRVNFTQIFQILVPSVTHLFMSK